MPDGSARGSTVPSCMSRAPDDLHLARASTKRSSAMKGSDRLPPVGAPPTALNLCPPDAIFKDSTGDNTSSHVPRQSHVAQGMF